MWFGFVHLDVILNMRWKLKTAVHKTEPLWESTVSLTGFWRELGVEGRLLQRKSLGCLLQGWWSEDKAWSWSFLWGSIRAVFLISRTNLFLCWPLQNQEKYNMKWEAQAIRYICSTFSPIWDIFFDPDMVERFTSYTQYFCLAGSLADCWLRTVYWWALYGILVCLSSGLILIPIREWNCLFLRMRSCDHRGQHFKCLPQFDPGNGSTRRSAKRSTQSMDLKALKVGLSVNIQRSDGK